MVNNRFINDRLVEKFDEKMKQKALEMICIYCLGNVSLQKDNLYVRCTRKKCRKRMQISANQIFYNSKINKECAIFIINSLLNFFSNKYIKSQIEIDKKSILRIKNMIFPMINNINHVDNTMIGGENIVVEIDESKFGKRKYHRGHKVEGVWILGMVERGTEKRKLILIPVEKRDAITLTNLILKYVKPGSIIYTDMWKGYSTLSKFDYQHFTVNHSAEFVVPNTEIHTNTIEGTWSYVKSIIPKRYRTKDEIHFYLYLIMIKRNISEDVFQLLLNEL